MQMSDKRPVIGGAKVVVVADVVVNRRGTACP